MDISFYVDQTTSKKDPSVPKESWIVSRLKALTGRWISGQRKSNRQYSKLIIACFNMALIHNSNWCKIPERPLISYQVIIYR